MKKIIIKMINYLFHNNPKYGYIDLVTGEYEIFVHTKIKKRRKVYLKVVDEINTSTCSYLPKNIFDVSKVGYDGFTLLAIIESNSVKLYWEVK